MQVKTILVAMETKILELATKIEKKDWKCELNLRLKFFTGNQTWAVGGQMATKEKRINLNPRIIKNLFFYFPWISEFVYHWEPP